MPTPLIGRWAGWLKEGSRCIPEGCKGLLCVRPVGRKASRGMTWSRGWGKGGVPAVFPASALPGRSRLSQGGRWVRLSKEGSDPGVGDAAQSPTSPSHRRLRDSILQTQSRLTARDGLSLCKAPAPQTPNQSDSSWRPSRTGASKGPD